MTKEEARGPNSKDLLSGLVDPHSVLQIHCGATGNQGIQFEVWPQLCDPVDIDGQLCGGWIMMFSRSLASGHHLGRNHE